MIEWIVMSNDPAVGSQLDRSVRRHAAAINQYRWDLVGQSLIRTRDDWRSAVGGGLVPRTAMPNELLRDGARLLSGVVPQIQAGDYGGAMRAIRGADQMTVRCERMLSGRLLPAGVPIQGLPPMLIPGGIMLQLAWMPSLRSGLWSENLLAGGEFDSSETMVRTGWTYQVRPFDQATAEAGVDPQSGETGSGALRIEATGIGGLPLAGGYAGTFVRASSAPISFPTGSWVRIEARVRTLGFGGPNQGLWIYDSEMGSEIGTLIRGNSPWRTITLYRLITKADPWRVTFEGIGGGEATIDWVRVAMWKPPAAEPLFRPISNEQFTPISP
jgi:hypothetical protein